MNKALWLLLFYVWIYLDDGTKLTFNEARGFYFERYKRDRITIMITDKPLKRLIFKGKKIKWVVAHQN